MIQFVLSFLILCTSVTLLGQVTQSPGTATNGNCSFAYGSSLNLAPGGNVTASDNQYATASHCACCDANTSCLNASNFGFSIPPSATIDGITVEIEKRASSGASIQDNGLKLLKNGLEVGNNGAQFGVNWPTTDTYITYGGSTDLWGTTWTPADINSAGFGLVFASIDYSCAGTTTSYIDHIRVTIHYTACTSSVVSGFTAIANDLDVTFTNTTTGATNWNWDFGDGNTSTLQNPLHTYLIPGTYHVCLEGTDTCGSDIFCFPVTVCNPIAAGFTQTPNGLTVNFTDISSQADSVYWDFGDGFSSNQVNPVHFYNAPGTYLVCQIAYNACTADTVCTQIEICDLISVSYNSLPTGLSVDFTDQSQNTTYWNWDFGDGNTSTQQNPTHIFPTSGLYTVCLISGNNCYSDTVCQDILVTSISGIPTICLDSLEIHIYPNPAKDVLNIEFPGDISGTAYRLTLLDENGKILGQNQWGQSPGILPWDVSALSAGTYVLQIRRGDEILSKSCIIAR